MAGEEEGLALTCVVGGLLLRREEEGDGRPGGLLEDVGTPLTNHMPERTKEGRDFDGVLE